MGSILDYLGVDYKTQFSPKWAKGRKYDFQFSVNSVNYVVETDGNFHYMDNNMSGLTVEETKAIDQSKDQMAIENGYHMIRIDCNYSSSDNPKEYIKKSILSGELSNIFDFDQVDFDECDRTANISKYANLVRVWNSGERSISEIMRKCHLERSTVHRWIQRASDCDLIKESREEIVKQTRENAAKRSGLAKRKAIMCNETGEIFETTRKAHIKYGAAIEKYFNGELSHAGRLSDGTPLTWTRL